MSLPIFPPEPPSANAERLLIHLRALGAAARTVELSPHAVLRREGEPATPAAVVRIQADLSALEGTGQLLLGEPTDAGIMVMLLTGGEMQVKLTAELLVALYGRMNEHEKALLERWETEHLVECGTSTVDWPGWANLYRRRYTPV
jgi:hypothetical protein